AAGLGEDVWRLEPFGFHRLGQRLHDGGGVLLDRVVDRVVAARARTLVIHAEAAADVDDLQRHAHAAELDEVAAGLAHAVGDVAHVGDLRAHVEVLQLQRVLEAGRTRTPSSGSTSSALASANTWSSSDSFSITMCTRRPSLRPISARRMYSRSLDRK